MRHLATAGVHELLHLIIQIQKLHGNSDRYYPTRDESHHCHHRNWVRLVTMNPQPIYTSVWWIPMVWGKIKPYCVNNTRSCWIKNIVCLRIALLKVIRKFCEKNYLFSINCRLRVTPLQPTWDLAVLGSTWSVICNTLF